ncbi:MAG: IPT/TIG domain-containing protein [Candidatus Sedimenticola sp. (ex Thyasira tokunagai)]
MQSSLTNGCVQKRGSFLLKSSSLLLGLLLLTSCAPKINSVKPNLALSDGGTKVTIKGDNLQEAKLKVDNFPVQPLSQQKKQLVFNAPAHPAGEVELDVSNNDGSASYFPFTYYDQPKPSIERIKPKATDVSGNVPISIIGKNLNHVTLTVGNSQPKVLEHTDTLIRFVAPANAAGISKVSLSSKNGKYKTSADLFLRQGQHRHA